MDALLLLGLLPRTGVVIKSRDTRKVMNGLLARYFDLVSVDRHSLESLAATLAKCQRLVGEGKNLLVFPEGTPPAAPVQHFNRLAFDLALAARLPVCRVFSTTSFFIYLWEHFVLVKTLIAFGLELPMAQATGLLAMAESMDVVLLVASSR